MFRLIVVFGGLMLLFSGLVFIGFSVDRAREAPGRTWCDNRGYQNFWVRGAMLCVDPKTRQVYFPE